MLTNRAGAETVAHLRNWRERYPLVTLRILCFVFRKTFAAPARLRAPAFAALVKNQPVIVNDRAAALGGGERWRGLPHVSLRTVDIMQLHQARVSCRAPADDVNFAIDGDHARVVARRGKRSGFAPFSSRGIIDLVLVYRNVIVPATANGMQFASHEGRANRGANGAKRWERAPFVRRDIVLERDVHGSGVRNPGKAAQHIDFPVSG